jgi:RNA polymerase sigma factor (sigma-70 family)
VSVEPVSIAGRDERFPAIWPQVARQLTAMLLACRCGCRGSDFEDVVQEVGERLWRQTPAYQDLADLLPYARTVARNLHRDNLRRQRNHPTEPLAALVDMAGQGDVAEQAVTRLELAAALTALQVLTPEQRRALLQSDPAGSSSTQRMRRARLRNRLRTAMALAGVVAVFAIAGLAAAVLGRHPNPALSQPPRMVQPHRPAPARHRVLS